MVAVRLHYTSTINVKKLTSLKLVLMTTLMTPVKPQISKFKAVRTLPSGLQRVMAALLMSVCQASQVVRTC
jgi:hypothetical protein